MRRYPLVIVDLILCSEDEGQRHADVDKFSTCHTRRTND
jgi:hypothetical protein